MEVVPPAELPATEAEALAPIAAKPRRSSALDRKKTSQLVVQVAVSLERLWSISEKNETFNVELKVATRWLCPESEKKQALADGGDALDIDWTPEWIPSVDIEDSTVITEPTHRFIALQATDGQVWIKGLTTITTCTTERYDLRAFPFDVQDTSLEICFENALRIEPWSLPPTTFSSFEDDAPGWWTAGELEQRAPNGNRIFPMQALRDGLIQPDFKLIEGTPVYQVVPGGSIKDVRLRQASHLRPSEAEGLAASEAGGLGNTASCVRVLILYARDPHYFMSNVLMLMFGIAFCSGIGWTLDPADDHASRLSLDFTLLLVAVAFKQVAVHDMPENAYLTLMDIYLLANIVFLFVCMWFHGLAGLLFRLCDMEDLTDPIFLRRLAAVGVSSRATRPDHDADDEYPGSGPTTAAPAAFGPFQCEDAHWWDFLALVVYATAWVLFNMLYALCVHCQMEYSKDIIEFVHPGDGWRVARILDEDCNSPMAKLEQRPSRVPLSYMYDVLLRALCLKRGRRTHEQYDQLLE